MAGPPARVCFTWPGPRDPGRPRSPWAPAQPDPGCRDSRPEDSWARPRRAGELGPWGRECGGSPLCAGGLGLGLGRAAVAALPGAGGRAPRGRRRAGWRLLLRFAAGLRLRGLPGAGLGPACG